MIPSPQLSRSQLLGANFSFQHLPMSEVAAILARHGFTEIELWGIAPHLDLFHASDAKVASVRKLLADHGLSVRIFTPEQVVYPVNIASGSALPLAAVIDAIARIVGRPDLVRLGARPAPADDPPRLGADTRVLFDRIGFRPRFDLDAGLRDVVAWWRARC